MFFKWMGGGPKSHGISFHWDDVTVSSEISQGLHLVQLNL